MREFLALSYNPGNFEGFHLQEMKFRRLTGSRLRHEFSRSIASAPLAEERAIARTPNKKKNKSKSIASLAFSRRAYLTVYMSYE